MNLRSALVNAAKYPIAFPDVFLEDANALGALEYVVSSLKSDFKKKGKDNPKFRDIYFTTFGYDADWS